MVASNEQGWRKVFCQNVQPGHVEEIRDGFFAGNGHAPAGDIKSVLDTVSARTVLTLATPC